MCVCVCAHIHSCVHCPHTLAPDWPWLAISVRRKGAHTHLSVHAQASVCALAATFPLSACLHCSSVLSQLLVAHQDHEPDHDTVQQLPLTTKVFAFIRGGAHKYTQSHADTLPQLQNRRSEVKAGQLTLPPFSGPFLLLLFTEVKHTL